jgi:hypothetical protein
MEPRVKLAGVGARAADLRIIQKASEVTFLPGLRVGKRQIHGADRTTC